MSDNEEPPSKVSKMEMNEEFLEESFEASQEEWLTEDHLTDDDQLDQKPSENPEQSTKENDTSMKVDSDLETTLNSLDSANNDTNLKEEEIKNEELDEDITDAGLSDDGNDTDDLLRMLQDGNKKKKLSKHKQKKATDEEESTDEEYDLEKTKMALLTDIRQASKAEPEPSDTEESQDEATTVQKMFKTRSVAAKSTAKPLVNDQQGLAIQRYIERREKMNRYAQKMNEQSNVKVPSKPQNSTPSKINTSPNTNTVTKSKSDVKKKENLTAGKKTSVSSAILNKTKSIKMNPLQGVRPGPMSRDESIEAENKNENEFLEVDNGVNEEQASNPDVASKQADKMPIMEPERMDEEVPTDEDSDGEGSYYDDELPTSDSDDMDDWFTLDLRSERAGEYIPMLGENARSILTEEKKRVGKRLDELRRSVVALSDSAKLQAEQIREATNTLNELEALIKAT